MDLNIKETLIILVVMKEIRNEVMIIIPYRQYMYEFQNLEMMGKVYTNI